MLKKKGSVFVAIVAIVLLSVPCTRVSAAAAVASSGTGAAAAPNSDLLIYDPTGSKLVGRAHYTTTEHGDVITIEGRNEFIDGERDIEHEKLKVGDSDLPRLLTYEHSYFDAHGAAQMAATADATTGKTSCTKYENGNGTTQTAVLQFPPDTYAGASVLVPIADRLRRGEATDLDIHVFDCALGPRILSLHTDLARSAWSFRPHDGELAKADAHPVFGWFNVFLKPFVPTIRLWFDPMRDFAFVGGMLSRYYRGPEVLLVSIAPSVKAPPEFERPAPPALRAAPDSGPPVQSSAPPTPAPRTSSARP